jgi:hypothetical protein
MAFMAMARPMLDAMPMGFLALICFVVLDVA